MFGMPFAAARTASKRTFLFGWHLWCCDGEKSLKPRSGQRDNQPKLTIKTTI